LEHPPYSLDLVPSDFHVFPAIKDRLFGHKFAGDEDVKTAVTRWFISGCPEFYEAGANWPHKCTNSLILVGTMLKNKVVSIDNTYLFCSKWQYIH